MRLHRVLVLLDSELSLLVHKKVSDKGPLCSNGVFSSILKSVSGMNHTRGFSIG